jgi:hypothetical protein
MEHTPHGWVLIELNGHHRIFASWDGGFLDGDSWKCNSGIKSAEQTDECFVVHGNSGSIYNCFKSRINRLNGYAHGVLEQVMEQQNVKTFSEEETYRILKRY